MSEAKRMNDSGRSKSTCYLTSTETIRLIRDGEKVGGRGGRGYGGGGGWEREIMYTCRYTVTTRMTPALRRAAMRAIIMFQYKVHKPQPF